MGCGLFGDLGFGEMHLITCLLWSLASSSASSMGHAGPHILEQQVEGRSIGEAVWYLRTAPLDLGTLAGGCVCHVTMVRGDQEVTGGSLVLLHMVACCQVL